MSTYIGTRIVPIHCGEWDSSLSYEVLSIVLDSESGNSYIARKAVPVGIPLTNTSYWAVCAVYSAQLESVIEDIGTLLDELNGEEV